MSEEYFLFSREGSLSYPKNVDPNFPGKNLVWTTGKFLI